MNKNDFSDLENQIVSKVSDAFKAIDVANLKKDINYKAEEPVNQFKVNFNECNKKNKQNISMYIKKRPSGSISGIVCIVFGTIGISIYGLSVLTFSVMKVFLSSIFVVGNGIFIILFLVLYVGPPRSAYYSVVYIQTDFHQSITMLLVPLRPFSLSQMKQIHFLTAPTNPGSCVQLS